MPSLVSTLLVAFVATALSGCFGDVDAVYVPGPYVPAGWDQVTDNSTQDTANGVAEIIVNRYVHDGEPAGEVYLIAMTDVPFVDEHDEFRDQIKAHAANQGVALTETGTRTMELRNGGSVDVTEYDMERSTVAGTARGKAWMMEWKADGFVAGGLGFAVTEVSSLLGAEEDTSSWEEVQTMLLAADW